MQFKVGFGTDIGRKRSQNQDNGIALPELGLFIVSDGMGGHKGGETASSTAVEVITSFVRKAEKQKDWDPTKVIAKAIEAANSSIFQRSIDDPSLQGMGTTTTALLFKDKTLTIGHVGDSRCYFFRPNAIWQATRDHSLVQEKLRAGLITRKDVKNDRMKNVITRSVGFEKEVNVEIYQMEVQAGDSFLICSDGLSGLIEDSEILNITQKHLSSGDFQKLVEELIAAANANGGDDNITTVMIQVM
jgi:PPM family protein phosphatase